MQIYQGSNESILLEFNDDMEMIEKLSVSLHGMRKELKHWSKEDCIIDDNTIELPFRENETFEFPTGFYTLDVKLLDSDGDIILYESVRVDIETLFDKTRMEVCE